MISKKRGQRFVSVFLLRVMVAGVIADKSRSEGTLPKKAGKPLKLQRLARRNDTSDDTSDDHRTIIASSQYIIDSDHPRTRARADSGSDSSSVFEFTKQEKPYKAPISEVDFLEWWSTWSAVRGTHHETQAAQAYLSVAGGLEAEVLECTQSYLGSLDNPAKGYNPHTFLFDQVNNRFKARWPAFAARNGTARESRAHRRAREMEEEATG